MLKIKPQKLESVNCFEGLIISYASWLNVNYELMFADSWGFKFNDNSLAKNITLGERINTYKSINWDYLNIYHGIKSEYHDNETSEDIIEIIKKQLSEGYPTIIFMDNYWYPWSSTYKKSSNGMFHAIMVTGLDEQRDSLYCTDYMFSKYNEIMQISDFKNCGSTSCLALSYNTPAREIIDWRLILRNFIIAIKRGTGTFENMRRFSDEVITSLDIIKEMNGYSDNIWVSPLISSLIEIKNSRVNVSKMFKYIEEKESVKGFLEINKKMKQIEILWGSILGMVIKSYYSKQSKDINVFVK